MKSNIIKPLSTLAIAAAFGLCASCAQNEVAQKKEQQNPALLAKAKVSQAEAEKIALTKAPDGTVTESKLKEKKGKLIWSVEMTRPKSTKETEVHIDARTGKVLKVEVENPEGKEKGKEKQEKKD